MSWTVWAKRRINYYGHIDVKSLETVWGALIPMRTGGFPTAKHQDMGVSLTVMYVQCPHTKINPVTDANS